MIVAKPPESKAGICLSANGLRMYVAVPAEGSILQLDLSAAGNLYSAVDNHKYISVKGTSTTMTIAATATTPYHIVTTWSGEITPFGVFVSADETKMYVVGSKNIIFEYTMTPGDITTATLTHQFSLTGQTSTAQDIFLSADGLHLYVLGSQTSSVTTVGTWTTPSTTTITAYTETVFQYALATATDISTAAYTNKKFSLTAQAAHFEGFSFSSDLTKMYAVGGLPTEVNACNVYQYALGTAGDVMTLSYAGVFKDVSAQELTPSNITFASDGSEMYVVGSTAMTIFGYTVTTPWSLVAAPYASQSFSIKTQLVTAPGSTGTTDLRSQDTMEVVLGICEGPIVGLENGARSFYIGDTKLKNEDLSDNFAPFSLEEFPGDAIAKKIIPVLGGTSSNHDVSVILDCAIPVVRSTDFGNIDFIDVRLDVQQLYKIVDGASTPSPNSVVIRIEFKSSTSSVWTVAFGKDLTISGKTMSTYIKELRIAVPRITDTYDIRVTKITAENTVKLFSSISFESYQETVAGARAYDNTALVHLVAEATSQFSSIPMWKGVYKGLIIKIPSNYDPITRIYTGLWDGTFKSAWSNNPAWCLYDMVMSDRYGMKAFYQDIVLDKYDVYDAGQWCDESVPDGVGGLQPRYTFNAYLTNELQGKSLARYIAGTFNATIYDNLNGTAYLRVDKDGDACQLFTTENITPEGFEYSYTDVSTRYNDITVSYLNPELIWAVDRRRIFDQASIDKNGRIPLDFLAVGCINTHEALRRAQYKLITANTEIRMVGFKTNRLGQFLNPFDIILICDPDMGYGISGRLKTISIDRQSITLRDPIYLEAGVPYTIQFVLSNGELMRTTLNSTTRGYNTSLSFDTPLPPDVVPARTVFNLEHPTLLGLPCPFRVMSSLEADGNPDVYDVQAVNINRNKWNDADNLVNTGVIDYSVLPSPFNVPGPTAVAFEERYIADKQEFHLIVTPTFDRGAYKYYATDHSFEVWSRLTGSGDAFVKREIILGDTIVGLTPGPTDFKILGVSYLGPTTPLATAAIWQFNVINPKDPPADLDWIRINKSEVYWGYATPPADFAGFILRYHNQAGISTWDDGIQPHEGVITHTAFYTNLIPASAQVIMVRAVDVFGIVSTNSAVITRTALGADAVNAVETFAYSTGSPIFPGTKTNCTVVSGALEATSVGSLYGPPLAQIYNGGGFYDTAYNEMIYQDTFDVTVAGDMVIDIAFLGSGYELSIRPTGSTIWQPVPIRVSLPVGNYDFKVRVFGGLIRGEITTLNIIVDPIDIVEDIQDLVISATGTIRVPITKTYTAIKFVSVIIQGGTAAAGYRVNDKVTTIGAGPEIEIFDSANTLLAGVVDVTIRGY